MELFRNRTLAPGQKVRAYVNLHKKGMFSIVDWESGLVCAYAKNCLLQDAHFYVSQSGRARVNEHRQKLVHAWIKGIFVAADLDDPGECTEVCEYNPYVHEGFTNAKGRIVTDAPFAFLNNKRVYIKGDDDHVKP